MKKKIALIVGLDIFFIIMAGLLTNYADLFNYNANWVNIILEKGLFHIYDNMDVNYPPIFPTWLSIIKGLCLWGDAHGMFMLQIIMKLLAILLFIVAQIWIAYKLGVDSCLRWTSNLAIFVNVFVWGQLDGAFIFLILLLFYYFKNDKTIPACCTFATMCLFKHQGIYFILPLVMFLMTHCNRWNERIKGIICGGIIGLVGWAPFMIGSGDIFVPFRVYFGAFQENAQFSANAGNIWFLLEGVNIPSKLSFITYILLLGCMLCTIGIYCKTKDFLISCISYVFLLFMITWNQHDRYSIYSMFMFWIASELYGRNEWYKYNKILMYSCTASQLSYLIYFNFFSIFLYLPTIGIGKIYDSQWIDETYELIFVVMKTLLYLSAVINISVFVTYFYKLYNKRRKKA